MVWYQLFVIKRIALGRSLLLYQSLLYQSFTVLLFLFTYELCDCDDIAIKFCLHSTDGLLSIPHWLLSHWQNFDGTTWFSMVFSFGTSSDIVSLHLADWTLVFLTFSIYTNVACCPETKFIPIISNFTNKNSKYITLFNII